MILRSRIVLLGAERRGEREPCEREDDQAGSSHGSFSSLSDARAASAS